MTLMVERNLPPEMSTYRAAINGSCDAGLLDVAVSPPRLRALRATGTPSTCRAAAPDARVVLRPLAHSGVAPTYPTHARCAGGFPRPDAHRGTPARHARAAGSICAVLVVLCCRATACCRLGRVAPRLWAAPRAPGRRHSRFPRGPSASKWCGRQACAKASHCARPLSAPRHVQYALLSTCGDEARPALERSLGTLARRNVPSWRGRSTLPLAASGGLGSPGSWLRSALRTSRWTVQGPMGGCGAATAAARPRPKSPTPQTCHTADVPHRRRRRR